MERNPMYPEKIGVIAFKDNSFEVDIGTPEASPNVVFYREDIVKFLKEKLALIRVQSEFFSQQSFSSGVLETALNKISIIAQDALVRTTPPDGQEDKK